MGDRTAIEWTRSDDGTPGATWNPLLGCSRVSPGCQNCYAERQTGGRLRNNPDYAGLVVDGKWTGEIRAVPDRLDQPLRWRRPRRIFVNSMSDLFHNEALALVYNGQPYLAHVVARMVAADWHQFQVLTKRPQAMAAVLRNPMFKLDVNSILLRLGHVVMPGGMSEPDTPWPRHIWWGTSIESDSYSFRARWLRDTPAAVRFLSCEPLLGPLSSLSLEDIDWVIVGGESGPGARMMNPKWARDLRDRCNAAGVPYLFKQWGEWAPYDGQRHRQVGWIRDDPDVPAGAVAGVGEARMAMVGKKAAGRVLDGRTWDEYPA